MNALILRFLPWAGGTGVLLIGGMGIAIALLVNQRDDARKALMIETALHERDIATFRAGQAAANADHLQAIIRLKDTNRRLKDNADLENDRLRADFDTRVMQLPIIPAGTNFSGDAAAPVPRTGSAASLDGSGTDPVLFSRADAQICADNTRRLIVGHDWAVAPR